MARSVYVVKTNPVEGREEEYNDWYNSRHIPDVLNVPGFVAAQRFTLEDLPKNETAPYRYLALYEIEGDPAKALATLGEAVAGGMFISEAMDRTAERGPEAYVYTAIADRVTADEVRTNGD